MSTYGDIHCAVCPSKGACCRSAGAIRSTLPAFLWPVDEAGACLLLDGEGRCRIYEDRPLLCRIDEQRPAEVDVAVWHAWNKAACDVLITEIE